MLIFITQQVVALKEKGDMSMQLYNEQILNRMLDYIKQYQTENGKSPTYRLIGKSVGIENPGTVARYINQLKIRGLIDKDNGGAVAIDPRLFSGRTNSISCRYGCLRYADISGRKYRGEFSITRRAVWE